MTPTQFDAIVTLLEAIQTRLDRMEARQEAIQATINAASEPIEPFNAAQDASEAVKGSKLPKDNQTA